MSEQNIDLVKQGYACFSTGDIPGLLNLFTDDITWIMPKVDSAFYEVTTNGKQNVGEFFQKLGATEEYTLFEPREFIASGDRVVVVGSSEATVRETNRTFKTDWCHIFTIRDSKVSAFHEFFDTAEVDRAHQMATTA